MTRGLRNQNPCLIQFKHIMNSLCGQNVYSMPRVDGGLGGNIDRIK